MTKKHSTSLTVLPPEAKALAAVSKEFENAKKWWSGTRAASEMVVLGAVMTGGELIRLYKLYGIQRGGDRRSNGSGNRLNWEDLVKEHLGISADWARKLTALAVGMAKKVKGLEDAFGKPVERLPDALMKELRKRIGDSTIKELMQETGVLKKPKAIGGGAGRPKGAVSEQEDIAELARMEVWGVQFAVGRLALEQEFEVHLHSVPLRTDKAGVEHENASLTELAESLKLALKRVTNIQIKREKGARK